MPALQVRDFPQELYEELREYSARHHRSMAQQTIAAVDQIIHKEQATCASALPTVTAGSEVDSRLQKREEVLTRAARRRALRGKDMPNPVDMLAQARSERDERFNELVHDMNGSHE